MIITIERLILGGSFLLLLMFSLFLIFLNRKFVPTKDLHRMLGASGMVSATTLIYMYLHLIAASQYLLHILRIVLTLACIIVYLIIAIKVFQGIISRLHITIDKSTAEEPLPYDETEDDDDTEVTDNEGNPIPQPSVDNIEDIIFFQKLESIMATKRLFGDPDITREQVAMEVGTNRTYLIRSIKLATGKTFSEYLTDLRVNYAATLLTTTDEPLDYIGTMAGFRSKSVYYRAFAAANNCTPSEYRNRNK